MHKTVTRLLISAAAAAALALGLAQAQTPTPAAQAPAIVTAPASPQLTLRDIYDRVEAAGYRDIRGIEWDDGRYEVKASNAQGQRMKLYVNARSGVIEHTRARR